MSGHSTAPAGKETLPPNRPLPWAAGLSPQALPLASRIGGHRGAAGLAPENTLAGLRVAARLGLAWVEVDVALTRDGVPVLLHDDTLDRTTSLSGPLAALTASELARADAGSWWHKEDRPSSAPDDFQGEPLPRLDAYLQAALAFGMGVNLEIKPTPETETGTARACVETVQAIWPPHRTPPLLSSFQPECLLVAQHMAPALPRALLVRPQPKPDADRLLAAAEALDLACLNLPIGLLTDPKMRQALRQAGPSLIGWTANDSALVEFLLEVGVGAVISDYPDRLLAELGEPSA